ncbi:MULTISPECIES: NAD(P)/FAD-dependent oxidoreductase [Lysinibacillus]|uniref:NAD(P)/FAD-dependent oxidoreductase n=1 Tax=Lysinibacillus TaxID=400634 RepID=UPI0004DB002F|nr:MULTISPECIES: NAD(P)/FAD-dependent oxidoreductase [Lysinibacillus]AJK90113.1 thioredoxin reductase [Lysinibacillus fusiformis]KHK55312.1 thioredoxin reductase [Lysinibacillus sp. A1]MCE4043423.1 NAD(P)/FAD-dependent oxidoreductase [Lysinibacillus fusiformis]MCK1987201.1 NAD(P)/FAD-dependent oxidoreductase [Lysinibacillus fusiformis]UXJ71135.1 NAD(P)/FAD-dependent oxidoreductase [Lysinibacillus fusiformis]
MNQYDCMIIGGGPAGLSAALTLGRARRKVALVDNGTNRNRVTQESHGFLTRDGIKPQEFKNLASKDIESYPSITMMDQTVREIIKDDITGLFLVNTSENKSYISEKILLATGIQEEFPLPQIRQYYGKSLFSCPYCDGWELRDKPLAIIAENEEHISHMTKLVFNWSQDLIVFTNGHQLSEKVQNDFEQKKIKVYTNTIKDLHGDDGNLSSVELETGENILRAGGFVVPSFYRPNKFAKQLNCQVDENGTVMTDGAGRTTAAGIYTAGETEKGGPSSLMIAAAEGFKAATSINMDITIERF